MEKPCDKYKKPLSILRFHKILYTFAHKEKNLLLTFKELFLKIH